MKRLAAVSFMAAGVVAVLLGLLFLVGFGGHIYRLAVAGVMLVCGAALLGLGVRWWKLAEAQSPEQLRKDILSLAGRKAGSLTETDLVAAMPDRAGRAVQTLEEMARAGVCTPRLVAGVTRYEFAELLSIIVIRKCSHCGWEAPLSSSATACPRCGAPIVASRGVDDQGIGLDTPDDPP